MSSRTLKELVLSIAVLIWSVVLFFAISLFSRYALDTWWVALLLAAVGLIWLALTAIALALTSRLPSRLLLALGPPLIVMFAGLFNIGAIGGALLMALALYVADRRISREVDSRRYFSSYLVFPLGTRLLITALILAIAGLSLPIVRQYIDREGLAVNEQYIEIIAQPLEPLINSLAPGIKPGTTMDEMIENELRGQEDDVPTGFQLSPQQREDIRRQLSERFNQELTGQETFGQIITRRLNVFLQNIAESNALTVAIVIILLAFIALRAVIPLLAWITVGLIALLLALARAAKILRIEETQGTIQRLEL